MNVIFSSYDSLNNPFYGGGGAVVINELAKQFSTIHDVTIISGAYPGSKNSVEGNVKKKYIGLTILGPKLNQILYQILLPLYTLSMRFDVWIESFTPPFTTAFLPLFTRKPVIGVTHFLNAEDKSKEYGLPFAWIQRFGIKTYKHIIALTQIQKEKIKSINNDCDVKVISNGTDVPPVKKGFNKSGNYILCMGRLEVFQKGLDLLIPAFAEVTNKMNTSLYIAGEGQEHEIKKIKQLINKYKLENKVNFLGRVDGKKKIKLLRNAQCLVMSSRFEGQSLTAIESIVSGTPIVCFDIDGLKWLSNKVALKSNPFDVNNLSLMISNLLNNKNLRTTLTKNCVEIADKFSWESVSKQYSSYIQSLEKKLI